jgi:flagellar basal-body rod modification protein FlgD
LIIMSAISTNPATTSTTGTTGTSGTTGVDDTMIASNFTTFLQLLTTQLQNQDPLSPMDTNQFTQQLVEFAQVEQQMKSNDQLTSLVSLQTSAQASQALAYVGSTVVVDGSSAQMTNSQAKWNLNVTKPATATITITDSTGATVYTGKSAVQPGGQIFTWNGLGTNGKQYPDGAYTLTATAVDANNQSVTVSPEVQGTVSSVDLTQSPPTLEINDQAYPLNTIKAIL